MREQRRDGDGDEPRRRPAPPPCQREREQQEEQRQAEQVGEIARCQSRGPTPGRHHHRHDADAPTGEAVGVPDGHARGDPQAHSDRDREQDRTDARRHDARSREDRTGDSHARARSLEIEDAQASGPDLHDVSVGVGADVADTSRWECPDVERDDRCRGHDTRDRAQRKDVPPRAGSPPPHPATIAQAGAGTSSAFPQVEGARSRRSGPSGCASRASAPGRIARTQTLRPTPFERNSRHAHPDPWRRRVPRVADRDAVLRWWPRGARRRQLPSAASARRSGHRHPRPDPPLAPGPGRRLEGDLGQGHRRHRG